MLKCVETRLVDLLTPYLRWKGLKRVEFFGTRPGTVELMVEPRLRIFLYATHFNNTSWKVIPKEQSMQKLEVIGAREN